MENKSLPTSDAPHFANFINAIRTGEKLNAEISGAQASTMLCHLANMAWRTGGAVDFDPAKRRLIGNQAAAKLWARDYRPGWEPRV